MDQLKPRLAIVSSHNICCGIAYYTDALRNFLKPSFDVEIVDLKTSELLRQEGEIYQKMSDEYIDHLCERLNNFDIVDVHLELGLYGTTCELILSRLLKICASAGRLILTVHSIDYKGPHTGHSHLYNKLMAALKERPACNPFHLIVHLPKQNFLLRKNFGFTNVSDFPLIFLTNEKRQYFQKLRNSNVWKKQFGFNMQDIIIGMFGLICKHKNYLHAIKTLKLLPENYKLLIVGEAHHMMIEEWKIDETISEIISYLDSQPALAKRVVFAGKREDIKYYEDMANVDFILLTSLEVGQSGSGSLSTALELSCAVVKSNTMNSREHEAYFPNCFEVFDIGNYYETKDKILNFDKTKIINLTNRINQYSEVQLREMYLTIYESMKGSVPTKLYCSPAGIIPSVPTPVRKVRSLPVRTVLRFLPYPIKFLLKKLWNATKNLTT